MSMPSTSGYRASWRDRAVGSTVNWIINTFATRAYRSFIELHFQYGRERVASEVQEIASKLSTSPDHAKEVATSSRDERERDGW